MINNSNKRWLLIAGLGVALVAVGLTGAILFNRMKADVLTDKVISGSLSAQTLDLSKSEKVGISFSLAKDAFVDISITNSGGEVVKNIWPAPLKAGSYSQPSFDSLTWDGTANDKTAVPGGKYSVVFDAKDAGGNSIEQDTKPISIVVIGSKISVDKPIFNPNNSEKVKVGISIAKAATYRLVVKNSTDTVVRTLADFSTVNAGNFSRDWDGKDSAGKVVASGDYTVVNELKEDSGVVSLSGSASVSVASAATVSVEPSTFDPNTQTAKISIEIKESATYSLVVKDSAGNIVKTLADYATVAVGSYTRTWDGKNTAGKIVPDGSYSIVNLAKVGDAGVASATVPIIVSASGSGGGGNGGGNDVTINPNTGCTNATAVGDIAATIIAPAKANPGYTISLDATQSFGANPFGENDQYGIVHYAWDFGDGVKISDQYSAMASHSFAAAGTYTVNLTVTDYACRTAKAAKQILVANLTKVNVSGLTDDAVQTAVNSAGNYGIVHLPAGIYYFDHQVTLKEGTIIEGEGADKTIVTQPGGMGKAFTLTGDNIRVTKIKSMNTSSDSAWPISIEMSVASRRPWKNIYVDNNEFTHLMQSISGTYSSGGTNLTGASALFEKNVIHGNDYSGMGYGLSSEFGSYLVAKNNELYTNRHSLEGAGKTGGSSDPNYISYKTGYDFVGNTVHGPNSSRCTNCVDVAVDMHMSGRGRMRIVNNTFSNIKYAIGLHDGWGEIKGNTFSGITGSYVMTITKGTHNSNNGDKCVDATNPNLKGYAVCKGVFNMNISNNTFTNVSSDKWYLFSYDSSRLPENVYINGCKVTSATYSGKGAKGDSGLQCP